MRFNSLSPYARRQAIAVVHDVPSMPVNIVVLTAIFADIAQLITNAGFSVSDTARKVAELSDDVTDIVTRRLDQRLPFCIVVNHDNAVRLLVGDHTLTDEVVELAATGRARRYNAAEIIEDVGVAFFRELAGHAA